MQSCEITLPWPPSVNHYKRAGRITRTKLGKYYQPKVNTEETKRFYWEVWVRIRAAMATEGVKSFCRATISVEVYLYPPDKRKRDLDNPIKALLDSMQKGGLYDDDVQIARLLVIRENIILGGQVIVRVAAL